VTSNRPLDDARVALAARQHMVVTDLLAGRVPAGFDPKGSALTSDILIGKRASAALRAGPQLGALPHWRRRFADYGREVAVGGCAHDDVAAFTRWLGKRTDLDRVARDWLGVEQVYSGARRSVWVRYRGRREWVVGIGSSTWHVAVSKPREGDERGLS
jgi:hypothetical protein